jgi:hypothetical protein
MLQLEEALIIIAIILIVVILTLIVTKSRPKKAAIVSPQCDTSLSLLNDALSDSSIIPRPGTEYNLQVNQEAPILPPYSIVLDYIDGCDKHPLFMLFHYAIKDLGCSAESHSIQFIARKLNPSVDMPAYPQVSKVRRNGQVLVYSGATNYGAFRDWILNEGLLY